jgi:hypothetical protein
LLPSDFRPPFLLRQTHLGYGRQKEEGNLEIHVNVRNHFSSVAGRPGLRVGLPGTICAGLIGTLAAIAWAPSIAVAQQTAGQAGTAAPPVAYASVSELNNILAQLKQTSTAMQADLEKSRIEKWKTDSSTKRQTQANVDSIHRNLQTALPEILSQINNSPEDLAVSFKLYRNLDALYDVFGSVVESAGAFGSKDEFQSLSTDMNGLETARRSLGERMQKLAGAKEEELSHLRAQVKTLSAGPPPPPKKIIVDDTQPAPKKPAKKKATKPAAPANAPASTPNPSSSN